MKHENRKGSVTVWQNSQENGVGEPAIVVEPYNDVIEIRQEDRYITINYETINALVRLLKTIKP